MLRKTQNSHQMENHVQVNPAQVNPNQVNSTSTGLASENVHPESVFDTTRMWNPVNPNILNKVVPPITGRSWTGVVKSGAPQASQDSQQAQRTSWRQKLHLLQGAAGDTRYGRGTSLSADADIVAYNVSKNVTAVDMRNWLAEKGVFVKDCKLLTTSEEARSLSYKITINPQDFDRATQDATLWPYRVGVRLFKDFNKNSQRNTANNDGGRYQRAGRVGQRNGFSQRWKEDRYH